MKAILLEDYVTFARGKRWVPAKKNEKVEVIEIRGEVAILQTKDDFKFPMNLEKIKIIE